MARIGLVQTRGIGDIVIALPIAAELCRRGNSVCWPVDAAFVSFLQRAMPQVEFVPIGDQPDAESYFLTKPHEEIRRRGCDRTFVLYSSVPGDRARLQRPEIAAYLKFDEYKYAVTGVPFSEKWNLRIERDLARENRLLSSLGLRRGHVCIHRRASGAVANFAVPEQWKRDYDIVELDERTDSPFDWILTLERAAVIVCIDSCFANLVEQLNLQAEKHLILRTPLPFTPVLKNGWQFVQG